MVLTIVFRTPYMGPHAIEGKKVPADDRKHYPQVLHYRNRLFTMVSNSSANVTPFRGCCMKTHRTRCVELDESHFNAHPSWDLFVIGETSYRMFRNDQAENRTTVVRFALVPHSPNEQDLQHWPNWKYLGACPSCMIRIAIEENIQHVLNSKESNRSLHLHMDVFADALVVAKTTRCAEPRSCHQNHSKGGAKRKPLSNITNQTVHK